LWPIPAAITQGSTSGESEDHYNLYGDCHWRGRLGNGTVHRRRNPAGTVNSVNHVIFMMQENRSFDTYFGMLNPHVAISNLETLAAISTDAPAMQGFTAQ
jgi:hypothetical protein